jgi:hypothetical protein
VTAVLLDWSVTAPNEVAAGTTLGERVRTACQTPLVPKSIGYTIACVQDRIDRQFRYFEALGEFRMFADGAVFVGARVTSIDDTRVTLHWTSAFYPGPRHRQTVRQVRGELLPLGFHGRFDLYLQRVEWMPVGAPRLTEDVLPPRVQDIIVARSGEGEATNFDPRPHMPSDVARALREGMLRARLLDAGPS